MPVVRKLAIQGVGFPETKETRAVKAANIYGSGRVVRAREGQHASENWHIASWDYRRSVPEPTHCTCIIICDSSDSVDAATAAEGP